MKSFISLITLTFLFISCQKSTEPLVPLKVYKSSVYLKTDKTVYHSTETIHLSLVNGGSGDIQTILICGGILPLQWSSYPDTTWNWVLDPSMVDCPSLAATFSPGESYEGDLKASIMMGTPGLLLLRVPMQEAEKYYAYSPVIRIVP